MSTYLDRESKNAASIIGGEDYMKHLYAMTDEDLHSKSSIAIELARRDLDIRALEEQKILWMEVTEQDSERIEELEIKTERMEKALLSFKSQYSLSPWIINQVDEALK